MDLHLLIDLLVVVLALASLIMCVIVSRRVDKTHQLARHGLITQIEAEAHTHNWRMSSAEQTQGKTVHVFVCYEHEEPVIERREVGTVGV